MAAALAGCAGAAANAAAGSAAGPAPEAGGVLVVDGAKRHQRIDGFGGTVGWIYPADAKFDEVMDLLFTDLGASILRVRALGRDGLDEGSLEPVNDNADPARLDASKLDFARCEASTGRIAKAARARGVRTFLAVTWSPPGWMKTNGKRCGGGHVLPEHYPELAELWAAYLAGMKKRHGVAFTHLTIQNEPDLAYYYPTCIYTPEELAAARKAVAKRLASEKIATRLVGPDVCRPYNLERYTEAEAAAGARKGEPLAFHLYDLAMSYYDLDAHRKYWRAAAALSKKLGRPLWMTEYANYNIGASGANPGSWREAFTWAQHIHQGLAEGRASAVLFWGLYFDKPGEALVYARESGVEKFTVTPKFYTSKNYFRFVRPGAVRADTHGAPEGVLATAFVHEAERTVAIVLINTRADRVELSLRFENLPPVGGFNVYRTTKDLKCEPLAAPMPVRRGEARLALPARSVTTLVGRLLAMPVAPATGR